MKNMILPISSMRNSSVVNVPVKKESVPFLQRQKELVPRTRSSLWKGIQFLFLDPTKKKSVCFTGFFSYQENCEFLRFTVSVCNLYWLHVPQYFLKILFLCYRHLTVLIPNTIVKLLKTIKVKTVSSKI